ncbi:hypothetical protein PMI01_03855 [Caulobacter sp. AP07]|uniref:hypothetical protein n=1 Tax=Caulobacter sp. AP07 TaxID=1144304 RepID=UPI0002721184|nr:hypothetical protein [Caulobacter sp. AP07]EJL27374.1 hypothetical protein PMI01_03855 [Caulobacter sp. AP07]
MDLATLDAELFNQLRRRMPATTRKWMMELYGVSETTWRKLRDGRPVKRTTLERVLARFEQASAPCVPSVEVWPACFLWLDPLAT